MGYPSGLMSTEVAFNTRLSQPIFSSKLGVSHIVKRAFDRNVGVQRNA